MGRRMGDASASKELIARYRAVYGVAFDISKKYFSRYPLPRSYSFSRDVEMAIRDGCRKDSNYPTLFAQEMLHTVCKWFNNEFKDFTRDDIPKIFNKTWAFHKPYIGIELDDAKRDEILAQSDNIMKEIPLVAKGIVLAAMHEMDRASQKKERENE